MTILHLNLKKEYFEEIKKGHKSYEYRLFNDYWCKKLIGKTYDEIHIKLGYPRSTDFHKIIKFPFIGYEVQNIIHKHFGEKEIKVFAIYLYQSLPIEHVSYALGHTNIEITQKYITVKPEISKEVINKVFRSVEEVGAYGEKE